MSLEQCTVAWDLDSPDWHECALDKGHDGDHECCSGAGGTCPQEPEGRES